MALRLDIIIGTLIGVPAALFGAAVWVFAESGFDAVSAALLALAVAALLFAISLLRSMLAAVDGELGEHMPSIWRALVRRIILNPMLRFARLPEVSVSDEEPDDDA